MCLEVNLCTKHETFEKTGFGDVCERNEQVARGTKLKNDLGVPAGIPGDTAWGTNY